MNANILMNHAEEDGAKYRRTGLDRRQNRPIPKAPFFDSCDNEVSQNRRMQVDRRKDDNSGS